MKPTISVLVLAILSVVLAGTLAQAGVIEFLTQDTWEGGSGQTGLPDDAFISWLQGQGHTVIKNVISANIVASTFHDKAHADGANLIIIGPRNTSSYYADKALNQIDIPMLSLMAHVIQTSRMDWVASGPGGDNVAWTTEVVVRPANPWVAGLSNVWFNYPPQGAATGGDTRWTTAVETDAVNHMVGNGTVISLRDGTVAPLNATNPVEFAVWQAGTPFYSGTTQTPAAERVFLGVTDWARYSGTAPNGYQCSFDNLTADGKEVLLRTINGMVPEPATLALLGLGVGGLLLRRRRG